MLGKKANTLVSPNYKRVVQKIGSHFCQQTVLVVSNDAFIGSVRNDMRLQQWCGSPSCPITVSVPGRKTRERRNFVDKRSTLPIIILMKEVCESWIDILFFFFLGERKVKCEPIF